MYNDPRSHFLALFRHLHRQYRFCIKEVTMKIVRSISVQILAGIILLPMVMTSPSAVARSGGGTELVSISSSGSQANQANYALALSSTGDFVAFASAATNLVPGDTNGVADIFVRNRTKGTTERVSVSAQGAQADGDSFNPSISADGRFVAFESDATNLVSTDTNAMLDVFVHDGQTGTTQRISVSTTGAQANGLSRNAAISADGRYVAFTSDATNLVSGDTNNAADIFVRDMQLQTTERVSLATDGSQANDLSDEAAITPDGRFVAFASFATNLVSGDTNGVSDIFVRDRLSGSTERVSLYPSSNQGTSDCATPSISADGRYVAFAAHDFTTTDPSLSGMLALYLRDRQTSTTEQISVATDGSTANQNSYFPTLSADGRFVAFISDAWNLVGGDTNGKTDVFLRDRVAHATIRLSTAPNGGQANGSSDAAVISADGQVIGFRSDATNLVDQNLAGIQSQIFITDQLGN
jgi:Tol biopolymer transport system component